METMHVNGQGEAIPAPTLCLSENPRFRGMLCELSLGHNGKCTHVRLMDVPGGRRPYMKRFEWDPPLVYESTSSNVMDNSEKVRLGVWGQRPSKLPFPDEPVPTVVRDGEDSGDEE